MSKKKENEKAVIVHGIKIHYGIGGLHACTSSGIYSSTDKEELLDIDVAGYYVDIVAQHGLSEKIFPAHLGITLPRVAQRIKEERAKYPKGSSRNNGLKLSGNGGIFGSSKDKFSPLYDILYFLKIVIAGQTMILRLIEDLYTQEPSIKFIQVNTDGITILIDKTIKERILNICHEWEIWSKMTLEYVTYTNMWIANVNNYFAESITGKVKYKGAYEIGREMHKNHGMHIVRQAVSNYFLKHIPVKETIMNCTNIYDFCKRFKASAGWKAEFHHIVNGEKKIDILSRNVRYFVSIGNGALYKRKVTEKDIERDKLNYLFSNNLLFEDDNFDFPVKKISTQFIGIEAGRSITPFNKYYEKNIKEYRIDYNYYIQEANKLINDISDGQTNLFG